MGIMLERIKTYIETKISPSGPLVVSATDYGISANMMSRDGLKVVDRLQKAGFQAYIVGGCVRDLLLGLKPKDFDVATDAQPDEVRRLFRRSRIIGRRFQIVHVQFSRELIEVTTFRSNENVQDNDHAKRSTQRAQSKSGLLTRDNVFGSIQDDATRRDLTVNALYYNPADNSIHDFTKGLEDIESKLIRIIGNPSARFREDPVRLLRVVRFAAKLGFDIDANTAKPISKRASDLQQVSPPRLFDETLKLYMSGRGSATYNLLKQYGLFRYLVPQLHRIMQSDQDNIDGLIEQAFINTDRRIAANQRVTPAFIYAVLLWPVVMSKAAQHGQKGNSASYALSKAGSEVISNQVAVTAIPKRFTVPMREIWDLQIQLPRRGGNRAQRLSEHPRFRAAYDFILLREQSGEDLDGLGDWWTKYQSADDDARLSMVKSLPRNPTGNRRRNRRRGPKKS